MHILIVGSGGREHALAFKCLQDGATVSAAPGNPGMAADGVTCLQDLAADNIDGITEWCLSHQPDLVIVGPEAPLVLGLADKLHDIDISVFGPTAQAAQLEGSKAFMKHLCDQAGLPTAAYGEFTTLPEALAYIETHPTPIVVKADGLAAGKGVIICETRDDARQAVTDMLEGDAFGEAGAKIVIEEFLDGEEVSYFALCSGEDVLPLISAQDHKRVGDGDTGLNTGGMGAYSPAPVLTPALEQDVIETMLKPLAKQMVANGYPFTGVLFAGLMIVNGKALVLEFNARFGDPECEVLMRRLQSSLPDLLKAAADGTLSGMSATWSQDHALCVVMAADGYPGAYKKGTPINGIEAADGIANAKVFHAGTALKDNQLVAAGGRVLAVTGTGATLREAQQSAYDAIAAIDWQDGFCRKDIGWRALTPGLKKTA
jgi:phosphoribosylamine--glycine ligase